MAIYSLNAKMVSRGAGQSLVAQTAYITRSSMVDERTGVTHSFSEKYAEGNGEKGAFSSEKNTPFENENRGESGDHLDHDASKNLESDVENDLKKDEFEASNIAEKSSNLNDQDHHIHPDLSGSDLALKEDSVSFSSRGGEVVEDRFLSSSLHGLDRVKEKVVAFVSLPDGADDDLNNPERLANAIEGFEDKIADKRFRIDQPNREKAAKSALAKEQFLNSTQTAQSLIVALRRGVSEDQQLASAKEFVEEVFVARGLPVIGSLHLDDHNPHLHLKVGRRAIENGEFSDKKDRWIVSKEGLNFTRAKWAEVDNRVARSYGDFEEIDHRSYAARGIDLEPTRHEGWYGKYIESVGDISRIGLENQSIRLSNLEKQALDPGLLVKSLTAESSLFTRDQLGRAFASRIVNDEGFLSLHQKLVGMGEGADLGEADHVMLAHYWADRCLNDDSVVTSGFNHAGEKLYSLRESVAHEQAFEKDIFALKQARSYGRFFNREIVASAIEKQISAFNKGSDFELNSEQRAAIHHLCGKGASLRVMNGAAGTGKTKVLSQVAELYRDHGYRVMGASFQASAVEVLASDIGGECRTLHSLQLAWEKGHLSLGKKDVLIVDEANMVSSDLYRSVLDEVKRSGATLLMVGDKNQILSRGKVDVFRAARDSVGSSDLTQIVRQKSDWMREASAGLSNHDVERGLAAYEREGRVHFHDSEGHLSDAVLHDVSEHLASGGQYQDLLVSAHKNITVQALNRHLRAGLVTRGVLKLGLSFTQKGSKQEFAVGDRIMFNKNDHRGEYVKDIGLFKTNQGVKNGNRGEIVGVDIAKGHVRVRLDHDGTSGREVHFDLKTFNHYELGYASTVNKSEGRTVDKHILVMDGASSANKFYVGMTRHRSDMQVHVSSDYASDFRGLVQKIGFAEVKYSNMDLGHLHVSDRHLVTQYTDLQGQLKEAYGADARPDALIGDLQGELRSITHRMLDRWDKIEGFCLHNGIRKDWVEASAGVRSRFEHLSQVEAKHSELIDSYNIEKHPYQKLVKGAALARALGHDEAGAHSYSRLRDSDIGQKDLVLADKLYGMRGITSDKKGEIYGRYLDYVGAQRGLAQASQAQSSLMRQTSLDIYREFLGHAGSAMGVQLGLSDFHERTSGVSQFSFNPNALSSHEIKQMGYRILEQCGGHVSDEDGAGFYAHLSHIAQSDDHLQIQKDHMVASGYHLEQACGREVLLSLFDEKFGDKVLTHSDLFNFSSNVESVCETTKVSDKITLASSLIKDLEKDPKTYGLVMRKQGPYVKEQVKLLSSLQNFKDDRAKAVSDIDHYIAAKTDFKAHIDGLQEGSHSSVAQDKASCAYHSAWHDLHGAISGEAKSLRPIMQTRFKEACYKGVSEYSAALRSGKFNGTANDHMSAFFKTEADRTYSRLANSFESVLSKIEEVAKAEQHLNDLSRFSQVKKFDMGVLNARGAAASQLLSNHALVSHLKTQDLGVLQSIEKLGKASSAIPEVSKNIGSKSYEYTGPSIEEIKDRISDRAKDIAIQMLGAPNKTLSSSNELRFGKKGSLVVNISGAKSGTWYDHEAGSGGHLFNLVSEKLNLSFKETIEHFKDDLGLHSEVRIVEKSIPQKAKQISESEQAQLAKRQLKVDKIIAGTKSLKGTVAQVYLKGRGISSDQLSDDMRFHPGIYDYASKQSHPALVCVARDGQGNVKAIQTIALDQKGQKADIDLVKRSHGLVKGSFVTVQKGTSDKLYIAKGPETAASIANVKKDATVLASLGISNFKHIPDTHKDKHIIICADHDDPKKKGQAVTQVQTSINQLREQGFKVSVIKPKEVGHDFNDVLKHDGHKAVNDQLHERHEQHNLHIQTQMQNDMGRGR